MEDECFNYGSSSGCDKNCPVYKRGECELQEEIKKMFEKVDKWYDAELNKCIDKFDKKKVEK